MFRYPSYVPTTGIKVGGPSRHPLEKRTDRKTHVLWGFPYTNPAAASRLVSTTSLHRSTIPGKLTYTGLVGLAIRHFETLPLQHHPDCRGGEKR